MCWLHAYGLLSLLLVVYLGLCLALFAWQRSLIYFPQPRSIQAPQNTFNFQVPGADLVVTIRPTTGSKALLYFGGNAEDVALNLPSLSQAFPGYAIYLLHYRSYGGSTSSPTEADIHTDALALFDRVQKQHPNVLVMGRGLGFAGGASGVNASSPDYLSDCRGSSHAERLTEECRSTKRSHQSPHHRLGPGAARMGAGRPRRIHCCPRSRSKHLDLAGRSFLHDYQWQRDPGFGVLDLIMTAPMVVTNWINLQYHASTVDNPRYGSGNKVLHNVVGGNVGVFKGNGGDPRIGLPMQSLHDGENFRHAPLRPSVFIQAPQDPIDAIIAKHTTARHLLDHAWLTVFRLVDDEGVWRYRPGGPWKIP